MAVYAAPGEAVKGFECGLECGFSQLRPRSPEAGTPTWQATEGLC